MDHLSISLGVIVLLVAVALIFDFMNGFHDAANSIATVVSTRVLKPYQAVMWAAFFNFAALFVVHLKVATTVGQVMMMFSQASSAHGAGRSRISLLHLALSSWPRTKSGAGMPFFTVAEKAAPSALRRGTSM